MHVRRAYLWCAVAALFMTTNAFADEQSARMLLERSVPSVAWNKATALRIDIDSDGKPDYVFLTQDAKSASLGLVLGGHGRQVITKTFGIGGQSQSDLCSGTASIVAESLDYDPTDEAGTVAGFRRSKSGSSFALHGGECDAFHFYWNATTKDLAWWRL